MALKVVLAAWRGKPVKDLLYELYIEENYSIPQIAEELKISTGIVCTWLAEYGITKNPVLWKNKLK